MNGIKWRDGREGGVEGGGEGGGRVGEIVFFTHPEIFLSKNLI